MGSKKGSETSDTYWKHSFAVFFAREECHSLEMITGRRCWTDTVVSSDFHSLLLSNKNDSLIIAKPYWLVVLTILKNMKVNGTDYPIYYGKIHMFETTNQIQPAYLHDGSNWTPHMFDSFLHFMANHQCINLRSTWLGLELLAFW